MEFQVEKIALSMLECMTAEAVRALENSGISYADFFAMGMSELASRLGRGFAIDDMKRQEAMFRARAEIEFIDKHNIRALFIGDDDYPVLLREIPDAPVILYVLGTGNLDSSHSVSIVGTRRCTAYGRAFTTSLVQDLAAYFPDMCVVSGLAYGIDAAAHTAALQAGVATVAVVAHGLDMIYPAAHRDLARRIVASGGAIVSEYPRNCRPLQRNFLERNRIIAGLSELTVVAESDIRGGAMSTANQAFNYSREVVALAGRYSDSSSAGCNKLIANQKAHIFTSVADLMSLMRWPVPQLGNNAVCRPQNLFPELEGEAAIIFNSLKAKAAPASVDELHTATGLSMPLLMASLTELEFDGIITKLPGSRYELA